MKIALITNFLYPEGLGGTELYCFQLANALVKRGNEVYWFVPNFHSQETISEERWEGIKVVKFAGVNNEQKPLLEFVSSSFIKEMQARDIHIAHFNEFGGNDGISSGLLAATKKAGIVTIVTLHLASYACRAGTLHYSGVEPCNGEIMISRCSSCYLFSGMTSSDTLNLNLARAFEKIFRIKTVQSLPKIKNLIRTINLNKEIIDSVNENSDKIVSLTKWFRDVLIINKVPEKKIVYLPQVSPDIDDTFQLLSNDVRKNYVFVGRVNKEKGVDLILDIATRLKKELPSVIIDLYGPYTPQDVLPHTNIANLNDFDNIRYKGILKPDEVLSVMNKYKAVILPSRVAEMAPLIIMEANKLKVPVIASDVPGSAELIKQYGGGLIFKYRSVDDLFGKIMGIENGIHEFTFEQPAENNFYHVAEKYEEVYNACS